MGQNKWNGALDAHSQQSNQSAYCCASASEKKLLAARMTAEGAQLPTIDYLVDLHLGFALTKEAYDQAIALYAENTNESRRELVALLCKFVPPGTRADLIVPLAFGPSDGSMSKTTALKTPKAPKPRRKR